MRKLVKVSKLRHKYPGWLVHDGGEGRAVLGWSQTKSQSEHVEE